jgi:hypothetical protein
LPYGEKFVRLRAGGESITYPHPLQGFFEPFQKLPQTTLAAFIFKIRLPPHFMIRETKHAQKSFNPQHFWEFGFLGLRPKLTTSISKNPKFK